VGAAAANLTPPDYPDPAPLPTAAVPPQERS
jgi:hypothetical protein